MNLFSVPQIIALIYALIVSPIFGADFDLTSLNPFEVLGLSNQASIEEIERRYRKAAVKYHSDQGGTDEDFKIIKQAYEDVKFLRESEASYFDRRRPSRRAVEEDLYKTLDQKFAGKPTKEVLQYVINLAHQNANMWASSPTLDPEQNVDVANYLHDTTRASQIASMPISENIELIDYLDKTRREVKAEALGNHESPFYIVLRALRNRTLRKSYLKASSASEFTELFKREFNPNNPDPKSANRIEALFKYYSRRFKLPPSQLVTAYSQYLQSEFTEGQAFKDYVAADQEKDSRNIRTVGASIDYLTQMIELLEQSDRTVVPDVLAAVRDGFIEGLKEFSTVQIEHLNAGIKSVRRKGGHLVSDELSFLKDRFRKDLNYHYLRLYPLLEKLEAVGMQPLDSSSKFRIKTENKELQHLPPSLRHASTKAQTCFHTLANVALNHPRTAIAVGASALAGTALSWLYHKKNK